MRLSFGLLSFFMFFLFHTPVQAQTAPILFLTWRAQSYVPEFYEGKALPSPNARIVVSLEMLRGGKRVNLTGESIYWYVDDVLVQNTPGAQSVTVRASDTPDIVRTVRASVNGFGTNEETLHAFVKIPTLAPLAIIESSFPRNALTNPSFTLRGNPFFFNISDASLLSYAWRVDNSTPNAQKNPSILSVSVPDARAGRLIPISLSIQNPREEGIGATDSLQLNFPR